MMSNNSSKVFWTTYDCIDETEKNGSVCGRYYSTWLLYLGNPSSRNHNHYTLKMVDSVLKESREFSPEERSRTLGACREARKTHSTKRPRQLGSKEVDEGVGMSISAGESLTDNSGDDRSEKV